jgi:hypothetical protein
VVKIEPHKKLVVHMSREPFDVKIDRTTKWGNPFVFTSMRMPHVPLEFRCASRNEAILRHAEWIRGQPSLLQALVPELYGRVLGCWCEPLPCHGYTLARLAGELAALIER